MILRMLEDSDIGKDEPLPKERERAPLAKEREQENMVRNYRDEQTRRRFKDLRTPSVCQASVHSWLRRYFLSQSMTPSVHFPWSSGIAAKTTNLCASMLTSTFSLVQDRHTCHQSLTFCTCVILNLQRPNHRTRRMSCRALCSFHVDILRCGSTRQVHYLSWARSHPLPVLAYGRLVHLRPQLLSVLLHCPQCPGIVPCILANVPLHSRSMPHNLSFHRT